MAKKISQLTQATEVKSDDVTVIVQDGETKKLPLNMMVTKQDIENKKVAGLAKLDEIEATYENDTYTPTITVKNKSSVKVGEGDGVDYSANVMDGHVKSAILSGSTKYRDIDTGEFLETFEEGRNLELITVRMPVLCTTGKNLFDSSTEIVTGQGISSTNGLPYNTSSHSCTGFLRVKSNTTYTITQSHNRTWVFAYNKNKEYIKLVKTDILSGGNFTTPNDIYYIRLDFNTANTSEIVNGVQIEEGSVATSYEPYKTNILHTPEEVVLREVDGVKDTLNLNTGEYVQRIGEVVLDGSQSVFKIEHDGNSSANCVLARFKLDGITVGSEKGVYTNICCDKYKVVDTIEEERNTETIKLFNQLDYTEIRISILKTKLASYNETGIRDYFKSNPATIQYQLKTPTVKTVDLIPSGTHPSTTPYCWKDGHIQLSSSGLLPSLEYSVVTSRAGQISQNAAMIVKNDKRIFDLEILLAGGLVNTTYQALTLQNQVETGLSKVSLSSEKEPDYLLYHMIMKLIEEKAYKLDDLAEKVSVFYLYEKLSDKQFETIYSKLYPFVEEEYIELPEDGEIIEEPVVDELPKEVEDEVVM